VLFQLVTLPVEFNASRRAMKALESSGRMDSHELTASRKVLTAAALTYVAALASSLLSLLRLIVIANRRR
jgi:Zn-dependent membrane protease YugP